MGREDEIRWQNAMNEFKPLTRDINAERARELANKVSPDALWGSEGEINNSVRAMFTQQAEKGNNVQKILEDFFDKIADAAEPDENNREELKNNFKAIQTGFKKINDDGNEIDNDTLDGVFAIDDLQRAVDSYNLKNNFSDASKPEMMALNAFLRGVRGIRNEMIEEQTKKLQEEAFEETEQLNADYATYNENIETLFQQASEKNMPVSSSTGGLLGKTAQGNLKLTNMKDGISKNLSAIGKKLQPLVTEAKQLKEGRENKIAAMNAYLDFMEISVKYNKEDFPEYALDEAEEKYEAALEKLPESDDMRTKSTYKTDNIKNIGFDSKQFAGFRKKFTEKNIKPLTIPSERENLLNAGITPLMEAYNRSKTSLEGCREIIKRYVDETEPKFKAFNAARSNCNKFTEDANARSGKNADLLENKKQNVDYMKNQAKHFLELLNKGKRFGHRDSAEFKAMKEGLQSFVNSGKTEDLLKTQNAVERYKEAKKNSIHASKTTAMRAHRLNLAEEIGQFCAAFGTVRDSEKALQEKLIPTNYRLNGCKNNFREIKAREEKHNADMLPYFDDFVNQNIEEISYHLEDSTKEVQTVMEEVRKIEAKAASPAQKQSAEKEADKKINMQVPH